MGIPALQNTQEAVVHVMSYSLDSQKHLNWHFLPSCDRTSIWTLYHLEPEHCHGQETVYLQPLFQCRRKNKLLI